ncbi:serine/threonine-protein kinase 17A-like [Montipora foliosa]|uniref:serine/threonine-protein kinase 17A-like n=1 Tax=Montipora foliosa TaxID=591990 RepID=UPI0035F1EC44
MMYRGIEVAAKILKGHANEVDLIREATAMHEIGDHPGVPFLYGICTKDTSLMIIMEYFSQDGKVVTLSDAANTVELSYLLWSRILLKLTEALSFIHTKGFIHNDLKGNNVLLCEKEPIWQPIVIDYGKCVKVSEATVKTGNLEQGPSRKRCSHIAPEVLAGKQPPSHASDMYSLGQIFQRMNAKLHFTVVPQDIVAACCHEDPSKRINDVMLLDKLATIVHAFE